MPGHARQKAGIVLMVRDHSDHGVGCSDSALDVKSRVKWAWRAVRSSPAVKRGAIMTLSLNISEGTVNGSRTSELAEMLSRASAAAGRVLPALAQSWHTDAPPTLRGNVSAKLGSFEKVKRKSVLSILGKRSSSESESEDEPQTVESGYCLPMTSLRGAKRAAQAMLVASVFAAELSVKERVPVLVLGRPPGHHATCEHRLALDAPPCGSPGGFLGGASLGGGCFYPSCWLSAVHCMREGMSQRMAYIDIDAHKPDGVWKEVDHLCNLGVARRASVLDGKPDACQGVLFASVHVNGYPNPCQHWQSVRSSIPKGHRRAFEVMVNEELLPEGVATGEVRNEAVLHAFENWRAGVTKDLKGFDPNGIFIGLGFDLHQMEARIGDKHVGIGIRGEHYRKFIENLPSTSSKGPVVLTLEGGYTKAAVVDGMLGVLSGLELLARKARAHKQFSNLRLRRAQRNRRGQEKALHQAKLASSVSIRKRRSSISERSREHLKQPPTPNRKRRSSVSGKAPAEESSGKRRLSLSEKSCEQAKQSRRLSTSSTGSNRRLSR